MPATQTHEKACLIPLLPSWSRSFSAPAMTMPMPNIVR